MVRDPVAPTRLFPVPKGFPPPVAIGDTLPGGVIVGPLCDRFGSGGQTVWRFYVQEPEPPVHISVPLGQVVSRVMGMRKTNEAQASRVMENSRPRFDANLLTA